MIPQTTVRKEMKMQGVCLPIRFLIHGLIENSKTLSGKSISVVDFFKEFQMYCVNQQERQNTTQIQFAKDLKKIGLESQPIRFPNQKVTRGHQFCPKKLKEAIKGYLNSED